MPLSPPDISVVIPVWNEADKISADVEAAFHFFESAEKQGEVIISDDGSEDGTPDIAASFVMGSKYPVRIIRNSHLGKGNAVRAGIMEASGDIVMFIDSGNCIAYSDVMKGVDLINRNVCDLAHASRFLPDSRILVRKGLTRRLFSLLFRKFVHLYLQIPLRLTDTQCGLKIYRRETARKLYAECKTPGFMFDLEIILRAEKKTFRIREFPVDWHADPDSRLSLIRSMPGIIREFVMLKRQIST